MQGSTRVASRSRTRPGRDPLTRERIASAALELADRDGIERFSMRRLAATLGAGTMTLYGHFGDKQELLNAVVAVAVADQPLPEFSGTWREQAHQLAGSLRQTFARHPCVVDIWVRQPVVGPGALHGPEAGM